jgi:tetratricopeptide (TPR) repeat protein
MPAMEKSKMAKAAAWDTAYTLLQQRRFKESHDEFRKAADTAETQMEKAIILLGSVNALLGLREIRLAKEELERVRVIVSRFDTRLASDEDLERITAGIELHDAMLAVAEEKQAEALRSLNLIIEKYDLDDPNFADIRDAVCGERAFLLADLGSFTEALAALQKLEPSQSKNPVVIFYLGFCYFEGKDYDRAREKLEKAISMGLTGNFAFRAHWALGIILCELTEYKTAVFEFEAARSAATSSEIVRGNIFGWLEYCCKQLGLKHEAAKYALLAKPLQ